MLQHAHGCGFLIKKCDVKGGEGVGQKVNVIVTLRSAKVVWKCPLKCCEVWIMSEMIFTSHVTQGRPMLYPWPCMIMIILV